ncbi:hypothetical protein FHS29_007302 [Saccharothrix tamanrassetensis]|uniref:Uncharacterized protein n=1 Tax=Saccharothrix tamanrassetensis TaxID=1051531 RepID=A0A841CWI9_9PSEU|nr:DUF5994 family protein [Saccharothrix tamanrassetensis]MBB5960674.1 hypothetical protein [Saccharothrix tamanrassetensis]
MTSDPSSTPPALATPVADRSLFPLRLRLKPVAPPSGHVDGAWWPGSRDLVAELPALVEVLADRIGVAGRVVFARTFWDVTPEQVELNGQTIALLGFAALDTDVVQVSGIDRRHIDLLVIPPHADSAAAERALVLAASSDHTRLPADILAAAGISAAPVSPASPTSPETDGAVAHRTLRRTHVGQRPR